MRTFRYHLARGHSAVLILLGVSGIAGCPLTSLLAPRNDAVFNNSDDPTNKGATYIGSATCRSCHVEIGNRHSLHGHAFSLNPVSGQPPTFPSVASRVGVPSPPEGFSWSQIAYVIGGYTKGALFVDLDGFLLTTGADQVPTQWNLPFLANGTEGEFTPFAEEEKERIPYGFSRFFRHTTGARPQEADRPLFQENRPGIAGTWEERGVQCEACHGPGSNHVGRPQARDLFVDPTGAQTCNPCHGGSTDLIQTTLFATDGYIDAFQQSAELAASGGHASFACTVCHDPHTSTLYQRKDAIRNGCTSCHAGQDMALHGGSTFVRGDYVEELSCESCHMPFAVRSASVARGATVGAQGRMGDTRSHLVRIETELVDFNAMFTSDGRAVRRDDVGQVAITVDFVCLRCHNGIGNAFSLTVESASDIALGISRTVHGSGEARK